MGNFYKHIVIVHGIGREQLNETSVNFMNEFCRALPNAGALTVKNLVTRDTPRIVKNASRAAYVIFEDGLLLDFQDRKMNLMSQYRVERVALFVWGLILFAAGLCAEIPAGCGLECPTGKTYLAWAIGLVVSMIVFKAHTIVNKGLVQLWRYGRGDTAFKPSTSTPEASA